MMRSMSLESISRRSLLSTIAGSMLLCAMSRDTGAQSPALPLVVDIDWLRDRADQPGLKLVDVSPFHVYRDRHIESATHAWWRDTVDPNYPVFGAVLTQGDNQSHRQRVLDSLGLTDGDTVVVYDNEHGFRAARLVWFLRFLGFDRVALLDASYDEWNSDAFPIQSASPTPSPLTVAPQPDYYLVTEQLLARLDNPAVQILDIRTDAERADDLDGLVPLGQIPGTVRLPWNELIDETGHLILSDELLARTTTLGLDPAQETVLYGNFGVDTALSWLALRNAGFANVLIYDRGWAEWSTVSGLPQEPLS